MKPAEKKFFATRRIHWLDHYIDYRNLSELITDESYIDLESASPFLNSLYEEVNKFITFYDSYKKLLADYNSNLNSEWKSLKADRSLKSEHLQVFIENLISLARETMELVVFLSSNLTAINMIEDKFKKHLSGKRDRIINKRLKKMYSNLSRYLTDEVNSTLDHQNDLRRYKLYLLLCQVR